MHINISCRNFQKAKLLNKDVLMKKKEVRTALCAFIVEQLHKAGNHCYMAILGKDYGISLKYKKNTLLRFYLPGDYVLMLYESPSITLPSLKHSHTATDEIEEEWKIKVKAIDNKKEDKKEEKNKEKLEDDISKEGIEYMDPNYSDEYVQELKDINMEEIIARNLSHLLNQHASDESKKEEIDLSDLPQLIIGQVNKALLELENKKTREYGWHFVSTSCFTPNAESLHLTSSVSTYYDQSVEFQTQGICDVIYREYLVDFLLPPKNTAHQIHIIAYRVKRPYETTVGRLIENVKSIKLSSILNFSALHKIMFLLLLIAYFANRFVCGKYERALAPETLPQSDNAEVISEREYGVVETVCQSKNQIIVMVAVTFIVISVVKQIMKKIKERQIIARAAAFERKNKTL